MPSCSKPKEDTYRLWRRRLRARTTPSPFPSRWPLLGQRRVSGNSQAGCHPAGCSHMCQKENQESKPSSKIRNADLLCGCLSILEKDCHAFIESRASLLQQANAMHASSSSLQGLASSFPLADSGATPGCGRHLAHSLFLLVPSSPPSCPHPSAWSPLFPYGWMLQT